VERKMKRIPTLAFVVVILPLVVFAGLKTGELLRKKPIAIKLASPAPECVISSVRIGAQQKYHHPQTLWLYVQAFYAPDKQISVTTCRDLPRPVWTITGNEAAGFEIKDPSYPWSGYFTGPPGVYTLTVVVGDKHDSKTLTVKGKK
jgi:hypothetical protein